MNKTFITIITILTTLGVGYGVVLAFSPQYGINDGLVGYWTLDGRQTPWSSATAGTALDISGSGNNGTLTSMAKATAYVRGKVGQALKFDGSNDYVDIPDTITLTSPQTFVFWANLASFGGSFGNTIFSVIATNDEAGIYHANDGVIGYKIGTFGGGYEKVSSASLLSVGSWNQVAITRNGLTLSFYKNGELINSTDLSSSPPTATIRAIGQPSVGGVRSYFNGNIDDVRIYNRVLSAGEIKQLYRMGLSGKSR